MFKAASFWQSFKLDIGELMQNLQAKKKFPAIWLINNEKSTIK